MTVDIYIDQSVKGVRRQPGVFGYIIRTVTAAGPADMGKFEDGKEWTAHEIELAAIVAALNRLKKPCEIQLHSVHGFFAKTYENMWLVKWQQSGWLNSKGVEVEHRLLYEEILNLLETGGHTFTSIDNDLGDYKVWMKNEITKRANEYKKELENVSFPE